MSEGWNSDSLHLSFAPSLLLSLSLPCVILPVSMKMAAGIYLHIPFCASRCHYCNFATGGYQSELAARYIDAISQEILQAEANDAIRLIDTIYFGGGTPSTLSISQFDQILAACRQKFEVRSNAEITIEANPGTISSNYFEELLKLGINRISFGVQSFDDDELRMIDRAHDAQEARDAVALARSSGFQNISIDLIAGLPEQKFSTWQKNIDEALALDPEHLSVYLLELYKDAPLQHRIDRGEIQAIDDDLTVAMYYELVDRAEKHGYSQYEISNWSKPGFESRHNLKYWTGIPYGAFGVSAAGFDGRRRWSNTRNLNEYLQKMESHESPIVESNLLTDDDVQSEAIFLQLRLREGVDLLRHQARYGIDVQARYAEEIGRLKEAGLIEFESNNLKISRAGKVLANEVFAAFV